MMMMMMMMNCFCSMVDRRKAFSLISSRDHCQRSSPSRISDTPRAGFEPVQNLSSGFVDWNYSVMITTTSQHNRVLMFVLFATMQKNIFRSFLINNFIWRSSGSWRWYVSLTTFFDSPLFIFRFHFFEVYYNTAWTLWF